MQARLIASYHGVNDVNDFNSDQAHMMALYERAALPTEKGGMALSNVAFVSLTAFACSLAASIRELAKVFRDWIEVDNGGELVSVSQNKAPDVAAQVINFADQYRVLAPQGLFKEGSILILYIYKCMRCIEMFHVRLCPLSDELDRVFLG